MADAAGAAAHPRDQDVGGRDARARPPEAARPRVGGVRARVHAHIRPRRPSRVPPRVRTGRRGGPTMSPREARHSRCGSRASTPAARSTRSGCAAPRRSRGSSRNALASCAPTRARGYLGFVAIRGYARFTTSGSSPSAAPTSGTTWTTRRSSPASTGSSTRRSRSATARDPAWRAVRSAVGRIYPHELLPDVGDIGERHRKSSTASRTRRCGRQKKKFFATASGSWTSTSTTTPPRLRRRMATPVLHQLRSRCQLKPASCNTSQMV
jgi:hypothetical protein